MPLMQPTSNYYRITFHSDGTGGEFDFAVIFARADAYSGDGSEFGGYTPGVDVLTAVAEGIAAGIQETNSPSWDNITVVSIEAQPTDVESVVP